MDIIPILRVARPTDNIDALRSFYCDGLGLSVLYRFDGHNGFDGVIQVRRERHTILSSHERTDIRGARADT